MYRYIARRTLQTLPLLLAVTLLSFLVMQLAPGNYLDTLRGQPTISPQTVDRLTKQFGLDQPWYAQYWKWLLNALQGNFGYSFSYKIPIFTLIGQRIYYTLLLAVWSSVVAWMLALPLGIYAATHRNSWPDRLISLISYAQSALPGFFVAILLLMWANKTGYLPLGGATSINYESMSQWGKIKDTAWHMVIPVLVLGVRGVGGLLRQMRGSVLEVLSENYILAARARGLDERRVLWKHAFRNSINPLITMLGYDLGGLLAGAALVENVLAYPGLGRLMLESVQNRDIYVAMGSFVISAVMLIWGNLCADLLLAVTDPRIRLS
ncbi:MAG TPA: ABC transporter permease [Abditibacteriaceae bacterium]|nr:ABC transporter permease [Abditibacteriaceae bacterium]